MSPLLLFLALSELVVTVVFGQFPDNEFANPPPLPIKGTFTLMHIHILWCDSPLVQNVYKFLL